MSQTAEQYKIWYEKNKYKIRKRAAKWAKENPERVKENHRNWRLANKDIVALSHIKYRKDNPKKYLFSHAKRRAKSKGRDFSICLSDLPEIPEFCPLLGLKIDNWTNEQSHHPSIDRIDSSKGYIPGNVQIISQRANMLKNNATADELLCLVFNWLEGEI